MNAQLHDGFPRTVVGLVILYGVEDGGQLVAEEHGNDGRRRLVRAETVIVARRRNGEAEQVLIIIHRFDDGAEEQKKLRVFIGCFARRQQIDAGIGRHRPVVVLSGAVDTGEGLLMQQTNQTVSRRNLLHDLHGKLVVIGCDIGRRIDRRKLMLRGRHFVMLRLGKNAQLPQFLVQIRHVGRDARLDRAEIVVVHLLPLRRLCPEKRASREDQILTFFVHFSVHEEVFLLRPDGSAHTLDVRVAKQPQDAQRLLIQRLHGAQQRRFLIQCLAPIGAESRRDAEGLILDEGIGGRIPCGIASGLKGGAQAAGGEGGSVRLSLNQLLTGELHDHAAVRRGGNEAVVLLRGDPGKRLEPVRKMCCAMRDRPVLHRAGDRIGHVVIQIRALVYRLFE